MNKFEVTPMEYPFKFEQNLFYRGPIECPICHTQYAVRTQGQYVKVIGILRLCVWTCTLECAEMYIWTCL
jgi:hypothetical protein